MARRVIGRPPPRDPWRDSQTSELGDQVLPRWFVLLAVVAVLGAAGALIAAFVVSGPEEVPPAARRPPPAGGFTHDVGDLRASDSPPVALEQPACEELRGLRVAGSEADRAALAEGLSGLCELPRERLVLVEGFAAAGGVVRFAQFEGTGVDSTAALDEPLLLLNNRLTVTEPDWIAPLVAHELVTLSGDPGSAQTELEARVAEDEACRTLLEEPGRSRACADAASVVASDEPLVALREAGYR